MITFDITDSFSFMKLGIVETLRLVIDPELHINIIDLGLVYGVTVEEPAKQICITMTLSSPYCPLGESIVSAVKNCLEIHYPDFTAKVELVWEPTWSYHDITEDGKKLLGI